MSYIVLARKYRPQNFDDVVGQGHITDLLKKAISSKRIAHAYLFCGPRGIGKTSCARIFAKSLNCKEGPTLKPCEKCSSCQEITNATSFDVIEIDGASNRGIDEIRTLRENVKFAPTYDRYKIYIIDEVHMLTTEAFNALLKTLEEPPEYVKFIFATTEPNKVLPTIISRCQKFDFKRISIKLLNETLAKIAKEEKLKIDQDALYAISKAAMGSLRDALSILDQLSALTSQTIKNSDVFLMLGLVETDLIFSLVDALADKDCAKSLQILDNILQQGKDPKQLVRNLIEHFRHLMVIKVGGKALGKLVDHPIAVKEMLLTQCDKFTLQEILKSIDIFVESQDVARTMDSLRIPLEVAFAKLTYSDEAVKAGEKVLERSEPARISPVDKIINRKGHLDFSVKQKEQKNSADANASPEGKQKEEKQDLPKNAPDSDLVTGELTIEIIRRNWDAITSAVSRKKMSIAAYLQEGTPYQLNGTQLVVGFSESAQFHKETLEDKNNMILVRSIIEERFQRKMDLKFQIVDEHKPRAHEPLVKSTLEKFQGKVTNKWHRERP